MPSRLIQLLAGRWVVQLLDCAIAGNLKCAQEIEEGIETNFSLPDLARLKLLSIKSIARRGFLFLNDHKCRGLLLAIVTNPSQRRQWNHVTPSKAGLRTPAKSRKFPHTLAPKRPLLGVLLWCRLRSAPGFSFGTLPAHYEFREPVRARSPTVRLSGRVIEEASVHEPGLLRLRVT